MSITSHESLTKQPSCKPRRTSDCATSSECYTINASLQGVVSRSEPLKVTVYWVVGVSLWAVAELKPLARVPFVRTRTSEDFCVHTWPLLWGRSPIYLSSIAWHCDICALWWSCSMHPNFIHFTRLSRLMSLLIHAGSDIAGLGDTASHPFLSAILANISRRSKSGNLVSIIILELLEKVPPKWKADPYAGEKASGLAKWSARIQACIFHTKHHNLVEFNS